MLLCAWIIRLTGVVEDFSVRISSLHCLPSSSSLTLVKRQLPRYALATTLAGLLEANSDQNDNLTIPIFMWAMVSLLGV